jgi:uncharacterized membrane protein SpoIIM required for sporulation
VILDLDRLLRSERPYWDELAALLDRLAERPDNQLSLQEAERLEQLYARAATDLNRLEHGAAAPQLIRYLETLVARAYAEIYQSRRRRMRLTRDSVAAAFFAFPRAFRRHFALFLMAVMITLAGCAFGGIAVAFDPRATNILLPADYLRHPRLRVEREQGADPRHSPNAGDEADFASMLMTHNIRVSLLAALLGVTLGIGTGLLLFTNGVLLGAVVVRYALSGEGAFVAAWLLPHGAFEIPAVLVAGQIGLLIASIMLRGASEPRWRRFRSALPDITTLIFGLSAILVWAGLVEAFFSQHNGNEIAYSLKIAFGLAELAALGAYLGLAGRAPTAEAGAGSALALPGAVAISNALAGKNTDGVAGGGR